MIRLELPLPPSANRYWRVFRNRVVKSVEARAYQLKVKLLALTQIGKPKPFEGPCALIISIFRARRRGDLGNFLKVVEDAIQGVAFVDDEQVDEIHMYRYEDPANPRAEVSVWDKSGERKAVVQVEEL